MKKSALIGICYLTLAGVLSAQGPTERVEDAAKIVSFRDVYGSTHVAFIKENKLYYSMNERDTLCLIDNERPISNISIFAVGDTLYLLFRQGRDDFVTSRLLGRLLWSSPSDVTGR